MRILNNIPFQPDNISKINNLSLRMKVTNKCSFSCNFCHHEGNSISNDILISQELKELLTEFKNEFVEEIHLTGGEPTSYPNIKELVELLGGMGFSVKMTTNGQFNEELFKDLEIAGLKGINFSVHTLNPIKLGMLQEPVKNYEWGINALHRQLKNIHISKERGLKTKLNTVIQSNSELVDIIDFCKLQNIDLRLLDDLTPNSLSIQKIIEFLTQRKAKIIGLNTYNNSSSYSYDIITFDGFSFRVKGIRKFVLSSMCNNCKIRDNCTEWFYGIRLEQNKNELFVRLCIHRQDEPALMKASRFLESEQYKEIIGLINQI